MDATLSSPQFPASQSQLLTGPLLKGFVVFAIAFGALTGVALGLITGATLLLAQLLSA